MPPVTPAAVPSGQRLLALILCAMLAGCAIGPKVSMRSSDRLTTFGANPQFDNERYEMVDLITLMDPDNRRRSFQGAQAFGKSLFSIEPGEADASTQDAEVRRELALAESAFYGYSEPELRRNRIQDRLIGASDQRCAAYKVYLNRFDAYQQSGFGSATTLLGGAAGIVGGVKDARILGGLAGITSGVQAEIAQGFLGNLASYVIVPGIELRRKGILAEIQSRRSSSAEYTLQAALADAARYHGACTLVVGLEQAKEAIQTVENPGMRMMKVTLNNVLQTQAMQKVIARQQATDKLAPEDLVIPSFRVDDQVVGSATGQGGIRFAPNAGSAAADSPEGLAKRVRDLSARALGEAQSAASTLNQQIVVLKAEIATPTKPALTDKLKALQAALATQVEPLKSSKSTMSAAALGNSAKAAAALSCLSQLDQKLQMAEPEGRANAENDLALGSALVNQSFRRWLDQRSKAVDTWTQSLRAALDAAGFPALQGKQASDIDAAKLSATLASLITAGTQVIGGFEVIDFKSRGIDTCS